MYVCEAKVMDAGIILQGMRRPFVGKRGMFETRLRHGKGGYGNKLDDVMPCDLIDPFGETLRTVAPQALGRGRRGSIEGPRFEKGFMVDVVAELWLLQLALQGRGTVRTQLGCDGSQERLALDPTRRGVLLRLRSRVVVVA